MNTHRTSLLYFQSFIFKQTERIKGPNLWTRVPRRCYGGRKGEFKEGNRDHIITLMVLFAGFILLIFRISLVLALHSGLMLFYGRCV